MRLTIAHSKIKKRNLVLINNDTYQRETISERPTRQPLKSCNDDISSHLEQLRVPPSITSEASLILSRVGIFESSSYLHLTIYSKHRRGLGIYWRSRAIRCQDPEEISGHKGTSKRIVLGDRGLGYFQSQKIMETIQVLVPVGSGIYHFVNLMLTYY